MLSFSVNLNIKKFKNNFKSLDTLLNPKFFFSLITFILAQSSLTYVLAGKYQ